MTFFDRTESKYIEQKIEEQVLLPKIGEVVEVQNRDSVNTRSNHEVDVVLRDDPSKRLREVPILPARNGSIRVPNIGDFVVVQFLDGREDFPVVSDSVHTIEDRAPIAKPGMTRGKYDDLYVEAYEKQTFAQDGSSSSDGKWVRLAKKSADDESGDAAAAVVEIDDTDSSGVVTRMTAGAGDVTIDDTGSNTTINISTDGDVTIDTSNGAIKLAGGGNAIARKGDAVEVNDPDSGTITGTITEGSGTVESG